MVTKTYLTTYLCDRRDSCDSCESSDSSDSFDSSDRSDSIERCDQTKFLTKYLFQKLKCDKTQKLKM